MQVFDYLAGSKNDFVAANNEAHGAGQDMAELFAFVIVLGNDAALLHAEKGERDLLAGEKAPREEVRNILFRYSCSR